MTYGRTFGEWNETLSKRMGDVFRRLDAAGFRVNYTFGLDGKGNFQFRGTIQREGRGPYVTRDFNRFEEGAKRLDACLKRANAKKAKKGADNAPQA
jgi:hypothetical protein